MLMAVEKDTLRAILEKDIEDIIDVYILFLLCSIKFILFSYYKFEVNMSYKTKKLACL